MVFPLCLSLVLLLLSGVSSPAAKSLEQIKVEAQRYYWGKGVNRNYARALKLYLLAANQGDVESQYIAGAMYFKGLGVTQNNKKAFEYLYRAANNGKSTPASQKIIAESYLSGSAVPQNYLKAAQWYLSAATGGDRDAQNELAFMYFVGRGVEQDFQKSYTWYKRAADQNLAIAQYNLGIMWYTGNGVDEVNYATSYAWFSLAAANGFASAVGARDYLKTVLSREELDDAQSQASQLYEKLQKSVAE